MARMTMGQWRQRLGDAVSLEQAPKQFGLTSMQMLRAVKTGKVPLHTFRAADGRTFRMVKTRDLQAYQARQGSAAEQAMPKSGTAPQPQITMDGMKAAFRKMAES
ncbi:MAG: hypothetical protein KTR15_00220 [Phycisphaeraceae bacterium]|nr:hypothetical protein [Phycisphaeraceae bacterium]